MNLFLNLKYWLLAFRLKTLTAAIVPIVVATALVASKTNSVQWWISLFALLASLCIQIGTNLVNDAVDFKKGADTDSRLGPQRITQSGIFSARLVLIVASCFFLGAIALAIPLVLKGGTPIVFIGLVSILMGYSYTAGPFPLAYLGLGDIFVILFFGLIAVGGLAFLHEAQWSWNATISGLQIGLLCTVLIAINNLRDISGDLKVNKKTLPVRFGKTFARYEIAFLVFTPFLLNGYWFWIEKKWAALLPICIFPFGYKLVKLIFQTDPSPIYNEFLAKAAFLHLAFGVLFSIGILLS